MPQALPPPRTPATRPEGLRHVPHIGAFRSDALCKRSNGPPSIEANVTSPASSALALPTVVVPSSDIQLTSLSGEDRPLSDWLTTFPLVPVVLDPYTHESAWILDTARRILTTFSEADCRPCWIVVSDADDARRFLGPYADEFLSFADPTASAIRALGIEATPAFAVIRQDGSVAAKAEGWNAESWRNVAETVVSLTRWNRPVIPDVGDPVTFAGHPVGS